MQWQWLTRHQHMLQNEATLDCFVWLVWGPCGWLNKKKKTTNRVQVWFVFMFVVNWSHFKHRHYVKTAPRRHWVDRVGRGYRKSCVLPAIYQEHLSDIYQRHGTFRWRHGLIFWKHEHASLNEFHWLFWVWRKLLKEVLRGHGLIVTIIQSILSLLSRKTFKLKSHQLFSRKEPIKTHSSYCQEIYLHH
jgi:hypothetical protein